MICDKCIKAAENNRWSVDENDGNMRMLHPENCGCPCMHRYGEWEKLYSIERPDNDEYGHA